MKGYIIFTQPLKPTHPKRNVDSDADLSGIDIQTENAPEKSEVRRGVSDPRPSIPGILDGKKTYQVSTMHYHTGKCIRRFGGIYAYCRYFIDRKW